MIWWLGLFFVCGIALILAEVLVPGGILGAAGALLIMISMGIGVYAFPGQALFIIVGEVVAALVVVLFAVFVAFKTKVGQRFVLGESQHAELGYVNDPGDSTLVGKTGEVYTALRPSGTIMVGDERIDAVADGVFIEKGVSVQVTEVHGNRVVVEPVEAEEVVEGEGQTA